MPFSPSCRAWTWMSHSQLLCQPPVRRHLATGPPLTQWSLRHSTKYCARRRRAWRSRCRMGQRQRRRAPRPWRRQTANWRQPPACTGRRRRRWPWPRRATPRPRPGPGQLRPLWPRTSLSIRLRSRRGTSRRRRWTASGVMSLLALSCSATSCPRRPRMQPSRRQRLRHRRQPRMRHRRRQRMPLRTWPRMLWPRALRYLRQQLRLPSESAVLEASA
mmetsp:Transcript_41874/g.126770  ORF Transcript_41874/g.126770 Transcript_41874/m.126770 type:complete len:217 (+) Transcript_41874:685-1335(+)